MTDQIFKDTTCPYKTYSGLANLVYCSGFGGGGGGRQTLQLLSPNIQASPPPLQEFSGGRCPQTPLLYLMLTYFIALQAQNS